MTNERLSALKHKGYITNEEYNELKQKVGRWIVCSERLPEEDNCTGSGVQFSNDVLMSVLNIVDEEDFIDFGHTIDGEWYSIVENKRIQNGFDVIAWMPLPQPYKGESGG